MQIITASCSKQKISAEGIIPVNKALLRSAGGYTFVELLVAITILGFVAAPFIGLFYNCFSAITIAGRQTGAINLCRDKMESVKAGGYQAVYDRYVSGESPAVFSEELTAGPGFRRITEVKPLLISTAGTPQLTLDLLQIKVTVYWTVGDREYSETMESYLARR